MLIVAGLYSVLWGKYREFNEKEAEEIPEPVKHVVNGDTCRLASHDIEAANHIEMQKGQAMTDSLALSEFAVTGPIPETPMVAFKAPKPNWILTEYQGEGLRSGKIFFPLPFWMMHLSNFFFSFCFHSLVEVTALAP